MTAVGIDPGAPCHILAESGDKKALCGSKDYPKVLQRHAIRHRSPRPRCVECYRLAGLAVLFNLPIGST